MSKTSNQLEDVFQEVSEYFATVPSITVTPGEGSPPEQYTITYHLKGVCKEDDGDVYSCDTHVISVSLPFGFPHFPPNCLPESQTFHPDFDSSAICIEDAWEEDKSIVHLILHIGHMIMGEIYSKSNAFNEEAGEWYKTNSDQLPFDSVDFDQVASPAMTLEEKDDTDFDSIDTLDDDDFDESFSPAQKSPSATEVDTDQLQIMAKQKRFHALERKLKHISEQFSGRNKLEADTGSAIATSTNLFHEAENLEHQGKQKEALDKLHTVEELVSDYPMLQEAKERVQQAFDLLGDWSDGEEDTDDTAFKAIYADDSTSQSKEDSKQEKRAKRTFFEDKKMVSKKWILTALSIGILGLTTTLTFSYFSLSSNFNEAENQYAACQDLLNKDNFRGAEQKCDNALTLLSEVRIVKQKDRKKLGNKIETLLNSPKLKQGLLGNVMLDGKYVPVATKELILTFKEVKNNGDVFFEQKQWDETILSYTKALDIAKKTNAIDDTQLTEIRKRMVHAKFNGLILAGKKALASSDWEEATEYFGEALKLTKANPNVLPQDVTQLEIFSNQAEFNTLRDLGHQAFKAGDWKKALTGYQRALTLVKKLDLAESDVIPSLQENIARTKIYMAIEKGQKAFTASEWDKVIAQYEKALVLLEENSELLRSINTEISGEKLTRIMLQAEIIRDKQDLAKYLKDDDKESAIDKLQEIKRTITASTFADRPEFKAILEDVETQINENKETLLVRKQSAYLTDNFEELFLKHYPAASSSALSAPKVKYLKNIGEKMLFRLQCTEKAGGRPLRLQMDYLYSPANGSWRFYSEE